MGCRRAPRRPRSRAKEGSPRPWQVSLEVAASATYPPATNKLANFIHVFDPKRLLRLLASSAPRLARGSTPLRSRGATNRCDRGTWRSAPCRSRSGHRARSRNRAERGQVPQRFGVCSLEFSFENCARSVPLAKRSKRRRTGNRPGRLGSAGHRARSRHFSNSGGQQR